MSETTIVLLQASVTALGRLVLVALVMFAACLPVQADAIIQTRNMLSSSIAEYFVEEESVLLEMEPRERVQRDEISGEPLPTSVVNAETVLFVRLEFSLPHRTSALTLGGRISAQAGLGFVVYHEQVAVNDFRYLAAEQTLRLDWDDPWYSTFDTRTLRRTYFAAMSGFLYIEPFEVRKEIIVRPKDLEAWIDLGLAGRETIPVEMQADLKAAILEFLGTHHPVRIDGREVQPDYQRIDFLERTLKSSRVIDPPEELDLNAAMLGVIFVYITPGLPQTVTMHWDLFNERIQMVPASAVDQAGPLQTYLKPDFAVLEWRNFLKNPDIPTLTSLAPPSGPGERFAAALRWPGVLAALAFAAWCVAGFRRTGGLSGRHLAAVLLALLVAAGGFWVNRDVRVTGDRAHDLVGGLLHNVYRAFDYHEEERIYDVLAQSVTGDLLTQVYLEARRGLELASQGGARAKVKQVELVELDARPTDGGGLAATATWVVSGSIGHWGHLHQRRNQYRAALQLHPVEGSWKLTGIEILEEERL